MSKIRNSIVAKSVAGLSGFAIAIVFAFSGAVVSPQQANAQTIQELLNQIAQLQQQLNSLQSGGSGSGGVMGCSMTFTQNFSTGDTGAQVMELQKFLNHQVPNVQVSSTGAGSPGNETSYFGARTKQAVTAFQNQFSAEVLAPVGLSQGTGYWGPSSRAKANAMCQTAKASQQPTTPPTTGGGSTGDDDDDDDTSGALQGGAGSIDEAQYTSLNNEEVGEGEDDADVAGLKVEADDGSDLEILAVDLNFSQGSGATVDFRKYADNVSVWIDGEKLAEVDADEFSDDNNFDKLVSVSGSGEDTIVRAGDTKDIVVKVSGLSNIDSAETGDTWSIEFEGIRYRDATNAVITDSSTGDINDGTGRNFSFESFAGATNIQLNISEGDNDDVNDARIIQIDSSDQTDDVELLKFEVHLEGNSDVTIDKFPVRFVTTGSNIDEVAPTVYLYADGDEIGNETASSSAGKHSNIDFDDLDYTIGAGDTVEFTVAADLEATDTINEGDTIRAEVTETETDDSDFDAEDEQGDQLVDADKKGTAVGEAHVLYENAFSISNINITTSKEDTSNTKVQTKGVYEIEFDVEAFGADVYIATTTGSTTDSNGIEWSTTGNTFSGNGTSNLSGPNSALLSDGEANGDKGAYKINSGQSETFTLTVTLDAASTTAGFYGIVVDAIHFIDAEDDDFAETGDFLGAIDTYTKITSGNISDLDTPDISLNN